jgi:transposase
VKAIASAKLKNDRVDSETLAHLLRCDLLPESWKADRATQARRQQVRLRATLVRHRTRLKNQVHAVLHQQGLRSPVTDLFGKRGRLWLAGVKLPAQARESVNVCLRLLDGYSEEIQKQNLQLSEKAKTRPASAVVDDDSGDRRMFGDDAVGRDRRDLALSQQRGVMQLRRAGAASAGVGGQSGAGRDHTARFALDALDHGGSGAGRDALFSGGQALLRTAAAQEAQTRGAGGAGPQAADRGFCVAARRLGI